VCCVLLGLAPNGVYQEQSHQCSSWSLTPRFHPCLCLFPSGGPRKVIGICFEASRHFVGFNRPSAVHFCGPILQLALTGRYPASCPVEPGLSSRGPKPPAIVCQTFRFVKYSIARIRDCDNGNDWSLCQPYSTSYRSWNGSVFICDANTSVV
jgi:hypothetical protein